MDHKIIPKGAKNLNTDQLDVLRKRLCSYREQEAAALAESDPNASSQALDTAPPDVQSLQLSHVAEFAARTEDAMSTLTGQVEDLRARLATALKTSELAEHDRMEIETAYKILRDRQKKEADAKRQKMEAEDRRSHTPVVGNQGQSDFVTSHGTASATGNQEDSAVGVRGLSRDSMPNYGPAANINDPIAQLRREMQEKIEQEVGRRVAGIPPQHRALALPAGYHRRRERPWTPAEYLALIGERLADSELGFGQGVAGQRIVPRTTLPPLDSSLPAPLIEAGRDYPDCLREVSPDELQGHERSKLMQHVYGGETSSHQRRLAFCFDSRDWKTWTSFFNEFKTLAGREGWTALQKLNQLRSRVSGQASATANRVEHVCGRMTSVEDLYSVCQYHVLGETAVTDSRSQLEARTRGTDENIREYAYALLDLAQLAYPGTGQDHVHKACEKFISTVTRSANIKRMLYQNYVGNPTPSIETLASIAIKAERSEQLVELETARDPFQKNDHATSNFPSDKPHSSTKIQIAANSKSLDSTSFQDDITRDMPEWLAAMKFPKDSFKKRTKRSRSRSNSRQSRSSSHHSRDRRSSRDRSYGSYSKEDDICYKCGGKGHHAPECPTPDRPRTDQKKDRQDKYSKSKFNKKHDKNQAKKFPKKNRKNRQEIVKQVVDHMIAYCDEDSVSEEDDQQEETQ